MFDIIKYDIIKLLQKLKAKASCGLPIAGCY